MKNHIAHVLLFKTITSPFNMPCNKNDVMLYKSFSATLHDLASKWLNDLKPGDITSFVEMVRLFMTYYSNNKPFKKKVNHFFSMVQNMDESIKVFMKRFHEDKIGISNFFDSNIIQSFKREVLRSLDLFTELTKMVPDECSKSTKITMILCMLID